MPSDTQRKSLTALFRALSEKWPAAFNLKTPKPLKIGSRDDIRAIDGELSDEELNRALRAYSRRGSIYPPCAPARSASVLTVITPGRCRKRKASTAQAWVRVRSGERGTSQPPEPKAVPHPSSKSVPNRTLTRKAENSANRPAGIVVVKKRRRVIKTGQ
ncbi:ProQ/FINO family protein [Ensifer sp. WSM1721]|uniref:ProQ/FINO family protein n=1 Tax=Ensifer sp. WSM1721 TaxID=1041159 RepID=UPI003523B9D2